MLLSNFNLMATAPGGVARLRELILTLAVQGKLVPQNPGDEPASVLLKKIRVEKERLMVEGKIRRDKPLTEIADEEKPFEVPQGWEWGKFGDLALISSGVTLGRKTTIDSPILLPYLRVANVQRWHLNLASLKELIIDRTELERFQLLNGDLLITEGGDWDKVGRTTIWRDELPACLHQNHIFKARGTSLDWNPVWAELYLNSPVARTYFSSSAKQTTNLASINMTQLKNCAFPLPPLAEQSRIVARVEELMRVCDALQAKGNLEAAQHAQLISTLLDTLTDSDTPEVLAQNWQRFAAHFDLLLDRPQAVDAFEQTILQLAVRGLLVPQDPSDEPVSVLLQKVRAEKDRLILEGKIKLDKPLTTIEDEEKQFEAPIGWEWVRVADVVEMLNGYAFKSEWFKTAGTRLLRNLNISHGYADWSQSVFIDASAAAEFDQFALHAGDIVLSLDRPIISTGLKYAVVQVRDLPCLLLQRVARLAPNAIVISADFLVLWLQSDLFVGTIDPGRSNGVPHISTKQVANLVFGLPPLAEQSRIVARVEALRRLCADLRQRLSASQVTQAHLAEALVESVAR